ENLATKVTGGAALAYLLETTGTDPLEIEMVISCSEEAVGDRYQRGGGNMAKAIAEVVGCSNASGFDVKDFCAAAIPALLVAGSLVGAGVFRKVAVVAGGSVPKLGMKYQGHLKHGMPVLEDVLGAVAALVTPDDGCSPRLRLNPVGVHTVGHGGSQPAILQALTADPLARVGLRMLDVDRFATELHNPEVTVPQGSGNVPLRNYRALAGIAVARGEMSAADIDRFLAERSLPGFAPTQGHIASAICYLPEALASLSEGRQRRVMLLAKGSLFLGKMSQLSDGMSVLIESGSAGRAG
ncbi:MAG: DUF5940 domain-containing protein, partial [Chloroflexota bacterium]